MIEPCGHKLVVKPEEVEEVTAGGIILPGSVKDSEQRNTIKGVVVTVGAQCWKEFSDGTPWTSVGDRIVFSKYSGVILEDEEDGQEYRIINDEDVTCVIERVK